MKKENELGELGKIFEIAERASRGGCLRIGRRNLRNAFQVLRYAIRDWAVGKEAGVVLRTLGIMKKAGGEVSPHITEAIIRVDDEKSAEEIKRLLEAHGYEETK